MANRAAFRNPRPIGPSGTKRGPLHGFAIAERIHALSQDVLIVEEGSLYPSLYRMEEKGWIEPEWASRTRPAS